MDTLSWTVGYNDMDQRTHFATGSKGDYTICGENYGRNRWAVQYPDGDYACVDTLREAKAWAEVYESH